MRIDFTTNDTRSNRRPKLTTTTFGSVGRNITNGSLTTVLRDFSNLNTGLSVGVRCSHTSLSLHDLTTSSGHRPTLRLFARVLNRPIIDRGSLAQIGARVARLLGIRRRGPSLRVRRTLGRTLLTNRPCTRPIFNATRDVNELSVTRIRTFRHRTCDTTGILVALINSLALRRTRAVDLRVVGTLPTGTLIVPTAPPPRPVRATATQRVRHTSGRARVILNRLDIPHRRPSCTTLQITRTVFNKRHIDSQLVARLHRGHNLACATRLGSPPLRTTNLTIVRFGARPRCHSNAITLIGRLCHRFLIRNPARRRLSSTGNCLHDGDTLADTDGARVLSHLIRVGRHSLPLSLSCSALRTHSLALTRVGTTLGHRISTNG